MSDFPRKAEALRAFEQWVDSPASDLHPACMTAKTEDGWPEVVLSEGDNDFHMGEYVGWMNAWQALSEREAVKDAAIERLRGLVTSAYRAGAASAHHDTVEGCYNMAEAEGNEEADEWLAEALANHE